MTPAAAYTLTRDGEAGMKLTQQDRDVLSALEMCGREASAGIVAAKAWLRTSSPRETAARHLIKLTKLGLAEKTGTRMFPTWRITEAGRQAIKEQEQTNG